MIVIPTYNGYWSLSQLIKSLEQHGTNGHKVVIVDDKSTDMISKKYLEQLDAYIGPLDLVVERSETKPGYEAGCLVTAYRRHLEEETAILLQDSCLPTSNQWLTQFENLLTPDNIVSWIRFRPCLFFCFEKHLDYMKEICSLDDLPEGGFFGNIFMCHTKHLATLDKEGYFTNLPKAKHHSEAWERIWAILFHKIGVETKSVIELKEDEWFRGQVANKIHFGEYPHLKKHFQGRAG